MSEVPGSSTAMTVLFLIPPVIAFVLLAAHFLRSGNLPAAVLSLLLIILIFVRRPWAARTIQAALVLGSIEWIRSTLSLVLARSEAGETFLGPAIILGGVSLFTALASLMFQTSRLKARFGFDSIAGATGD